MERDGRPGGRLHLGSGSPFCGMAKLINELTWSVSRARLFDTCKRAYYYNYYGSWGGWEADADPPTRKLYLLKNITTLEMWAGSIVHEIVAEALNHMALNQKPVRAGILQARAREKLRRGWLDAVGRAWLSSPKKTNLHGLYYGNGKTLPPGRTDATKDRVYDCLAAFARSDILREIQTIPFISWKPIDKLDFFMVDDLKIWCAIDFAFTDPAGRLNIVDWKTGGEDPESLQLQLACYAFFAQSKWHASLDKVRLSGIFLRENARRSDYDVTGEVLFDAKDRILTSAAEMRSLLTNIEGNVAEEEDFPVCDNDRTCSRCNFREVCPRIMHEIDRSA